MKICGNADTLAKNRVRWIP